jgi:flagellum-specific peptidoglycan hydrolase FlgJ
MAEEFESYFENLLAESDNNAAVSNFKKTVYSNNKPARESISPEEFAQLDLADKTQYAYESLVEAINEAKQTGRLKQGEDLNALGILGQILLETGDFKSTLNTKYFNFGGHKADKGWKERGGEFVSIPPAYGGSKKPVDWRVYPSLKEGLKAKVDFFIDNSRYRKNGVMQAKTPAQHLLAAQKAGYAGREANYAKLSMNKVNQLPKLLERQNPNLQNEWETINPVADIEAIEAQKKLMEEQNLLNKDGQLIPQAQPQAQQQPTTIAPMDQYITSGPAFPPMPLELPEFEVPSGPTKTISMEGSFYNDPLTKQEKQRQAQIDKLLLTPIKNIVPAGFFGSGKSMFAKGGSLNNNKETETNSFATGGPGDRLKRSNVNMFGLMNPYNYGYPIRFGDTNFTSDTYFNPMGGIQFNMPFGKTDLNTSGKNQYGWSLSSKIGAPYDFNRTKNILSNKALLPNNYIPLPYSVTDDQAQALLQEVNPENIQSIINTYNEDIDKLTIAEGYDNPYVPGDGSLHGTVEERDRLQNRLDEYEKIDQKKYSPYFGLSVNYKTKPLYQPGGFRAGASGKFYAEKDPFLGYTVGTETGLDLKGGRSKDYSGEYRAGTGSYNIHPFLNLALGSKPTWAYGVDANFEYKPGGIFKNIPGYLTGGLSWSADPVSGSGASSSRGLQYNKGSYNNVEEMIDYEVNSENPYAAGSRGYIGPESITGIPLSGGGLGFLNNFRGNLGWTVPLEGVIDNIKYARANAYARKQQDKEETSPLKKFNPVYNPGIRTTIPISETGSAYSEEEEYR